MIGTVLLVLIFWLILWGFVFLAVHTYVVVAHAGELCDATILFEPRDVWVGAYWDVEGHEGGMVLYLYICPVPLIAIRYIWSCMEDWDDHPE